MSMSCAYAQSIHLLINKEDSTFKLKSKQFFKNEKEAKQFLKITQNSLIRKGYLEASFDSVTKRNDTLFAFFHSGKKHDIKIPTTEISKKKSYLRYSILLSSFMRINLDGYL